MLWETDEIPSTQEDDVRVTSVDGSRRRATYCLVSWSTNMHQLAATHTKKDKNTYTIAALVDVQGR